MTVICNPPICQVNSCQLIDSICQVPFSALQREPERRRPISIHPLRAAGRIHGEIAVLRISMQYLCLVSMNHFKKKPGLLIKFVGIGHMFEKLGMSPENGNFMVKTKNMTK